MDMTVIILICAGVCCFVTGIILFLALYNNERSGQEGQSLLDPEYAMNFQDSFDSTGSIEDTLSELSDIYADDRYMYNLVAGALDYIRDGKGDYETALDGINVDNDPEVKKMHDSAIRKMLGEERPDSDPGMDAAPDGQPAGEKTAPASAANGGSAMAQEEEEEFEEDGEDRPSYGANDGKEKETADSSRRAGKQPGMPEKESAGPGIRAGAPASTGMPARRNLRKTASPSMDDLEPHNEGIRWGDSGSQSDDDLMIG